MSATVTNYPVSYLVEVSVWIRTGLQTTIVGRGLTFDEARMLANDYHDCYRVAIRPYCAIPTTV